MTKKTTQPTAKTKKTLQPYMLLIPVALIAVLLLIVQLSNNSSTPSTTSSVIQPAQYVSDFANTQHILLDVRTPEEFSEGHIEGAVNIAVETLSSRLNEVPTDVPVVVYCRSGNRSATAAQILQSAGYTRVYDLGGIRAWQSAGYTVVQ